MRPFRVVFDCPAASARKRCVLVPFGLAVVHGQLRIQVLRAVGERCPGHGDGGAMASKINGELIAPEGGPALSQQKPVVGLGSQRSPHAGTANALPHRQPQALMGQLRPGLKGQVSTRR